MSKQGGQKYSEEMVSLMVEALGGDAQVEKMVNQKRLAAVLKPGASIGEVYDQAKEQGWLDWLRVLTFGEVSSILGGKSSTSRKPGSRMTQDQVTELRKQITTYIKGHPSSKVADIATAIGAKPGKVGTQLKKLTKEGVVKSEGAKAKTVYSLK